MSMLTESRVRSTSIERFRENQTKRGVRSSSVTTKVDEQVSWKQIIYTFGAMFAAGTFFLCLTFVLAFASILF